MKKVAIIFEQLKRAAERNRFSRQTQADRFGPVHFLPQQRQHRIEAIACGAPTMISTTSMPT
jgi:hypothetical protein